MWESVYQALLSPKKQAPGFKTRSSGICLACGSPGERSRSLIGEEGQDKGVAAR